MVLNDPYAGGTHLPDITMVTPVFSGRELMFCGFTGSPRRCWWPISRLYAGAIHQHRTRKAVY